MPQIIQTPVIQEQRPFVHLGLMELAGEAAKRELAHLMPTAQDKVAEEEARGMTIKNDATQAQQFQNAVAADQDPSKVRQALHFKEGGDAREALTDPLTQGHLASAHAVAQLAPHASQMPLAAQQTSSPVVAPSAPAAAPMATPATDSIVNAGPAPAATPAAPMATPQTDAVVSAIPQSLKDHAYAETPEGSGEALARLSQLHQALPPEQQQTANNAIQQSLAFAKASQFLSNPETMNTEGLGVLTNLMDHQNNTFNTLQTLYNANLGVIPKPKDEDFNPSLASAANQIATIATVDPAKAKQMLKASPELNAYMPGQRLNIFNQYDRSTSLTAHKMLQGIGGLSPEATVAAFRQSRQLDIEEAGQKANIDLKNRELTQNADQFKASLENTKQQFGITTALNERKIQDDEAQIYANISQQQQKLGLEVNDAEVRHYSTLAALQMDKARSLTSAAGVAVQANQAEKADLMGRLTAAQANLDHANQALSQAPSLLGGIKDKKEYERQMANFTQNQQDATAVYNKTVTDTLNSYSMKPQQALDLLNRAFPAAQADPQSQALGIPGVLKRLQQGIQGTMGVDETTRQKQFAATIDKNPALKAIKTPSQFEAWATTQPALKNYSAQQKQDLMVKLLKHNEET